MDLRATERDWIQRTQAVPSVDPGPAAAASAEDSVSIEIAKQILELRGVRDVATHMRPTLKDLANAFSLRDMDVAVGRLIHAFQHNESICVYADFDLDGTSGCALLYLGLQSLGFKTVRYYQPSRMQEGYGFHAHVVEDLHQQGVKLILTVDVGITSLAACDRARELGIEVLITDHHQVGKKMPDALAVINPNRPDCTSGLGYLSGAGVGFYLLRALKRGLVDKGLIMVDQGELNSLLDLVALATITDMVPLVHDNRKLVYFGLRAMAATQRPGLSGLLENLELLGRPLSAQDIGIRLAPKLNALSRLELGLRPLDILLMKEPDKKMISRVLAQNQDRMDLQNAGEQKAQEMWNQKLSSGGVARNHVLLASEEFHRGVVGLIATRMAASTGKPSFIGSISPEGTIVGSARRPNGSTINLVEALASAAGILTRSGGHPAAAGFELVHLDRLEEMDRVLAIFFDQEKMRSTIPKTFYDLHLPMEWIDTDLMHSIENLGPYGVGFEVPVFRITGGTVGSVKVLKSAHLKVHLRGPQGSTLEALWFSTPHLSAILDDLTPLTRIELIGELQWSYFGGKKSLQVVVHDLRVANPEEADADEKSKKSPDKELFS